MPCLAAPKADCRSAMDNESLYQCSSHEFKAQDERLNIAYRKMFKMLDPKGAEKLQAAQRAWITFRDLNGAFYADFFRGGTASRLEGLGAQTSMTKARADELFDEIKRRESLGIQ